MKTLEEIYQELKILYPTNDKNYSKEFTPFQLLCFIILTQQTTDERAYRVAKRLFAKYPNANLMSLATPASIEPLIRELGLSDKRSKALVKNAQLIVSIQKEKRRIKKSDLKQLSLVGPKTERIILHEVFNIPTFPIDTHIQRIFKRLYMQDLTIDEIEYFVQLAVDKENWFDFHRVLIEHGRKICNSRFVTCSKCPLSDSCEYYTKYKLGGDRNEPKPNAETLHNTSWIYRN